MLIKTAAVIPTINGERAEGMDPNSDMRPGLPPPWLIPHCRKCRLPCERFTIDYLYSEWYLPLQWQCCGRTGGEKVARDEVLWKSRRGGGLIWVNDETRLSNVRK